MSAEFESTPPTANCATCGAALQADVRFCKACGSPATKEADNAPNSGVEKAESGESNACPKCGYANPPSGRFCRRCRAELGDEKAPKGADQATLAAARRTGESSGRAVPPGEPVAGRWPRWAPIAAVVLLLAAGGVAALLLSGGGGKDNSGPETAASVSSAAEPESGGESGGTALPGSRSPASSAQSTSSSASRSAILDILHQYENAYSNASVAAMGELLAADVRRHGLAAGGCSTETGKRAVLRAYESQFSQNGPIGYSLVGLSDEKVQLVRDDEARVAISYSIPAANNSGPISFTLVDRGGRWQISEVDATCNPGSL